MTHFLKDIAAFFDDSPAGAHVLQVAGSLAARQEAQLVGVTMPAHREDAAVDAYARGTAIREVIRRHDEVDEARQAGLKQTLDFTGLRYGIRTELRTVSAFEATEEATSHAMYSDLLVMGRARPPNLPSSLTPLEILKRSGVPVLIVPECWSSTEVGNRVVVAWNESRQARRAIADALPLLIAAKNVQLLLVDASRYTGRSEEPGSALALYLSHHGVNVELHRIASNGRPVDEAIFAESSRYQADLLVFGAYSRPRISEALLGGVTRSLLARSTLPLFTS